MQATCRQPQRTPNGAPFHYERHRAEQPTLYRLVQPYAASFIANAEASTGSELPRFIKDEFDAFLEPWIRVVEHAAPTCEADSAAGAGAGRARRSGGGTCDGVGMPDARQQERSVRAGRPALGHTGGFPA